MMRTRDSLARSRSAAFGVLSLWAVVLAGCGSAPPAPERGEKSAAGLPGIEVTWVMVDDRIRPPEPPPPKPRTASPGSDAPPPPPPPDPTLPLDAALAPYTDRPVPISPTARSLWSACGFETFTVPEIDLPDLRRVLRLAGAEQRQNFAPVGRWSEIVRGPECRGVQPVRVDSGSFLVSSGVFRLLMRCWIAPGGADGTSGSLQVEFVPQHLDPGAAQPEPDGPMAAAKRPTITREGTVFERLLCECTPGAGEAVLIVPRDVQRAEDPAPQDRPFGPEVPEETSLARAILTDALKGGEGRVRLVLVITARPPREFYLTGR